ncbi:MAG TPA: MerR family transcriptional regulator [Ktedonobacteraceae bacterium]|jgi:MerR family copper efflux transcriptional regulator|nr:MerR family transcriptional regulator [Ktedonobacteraceae bacterium]
MKIHELAQKTGLTAPTIRFYEQEGLLNTHHVRRRENNYRDYCEEAVTHLRMIKKIQAAGFTLAELKEVIQAKEANEFSRQKKMELLRQKMQEISRRQAELEQLQMYLAQMFARNKALVEAEEKGEAREEYQHHASALRSSLSSS